MFDEHLVKAKSLCHPEDFSAIILIILILIFSQCNPAKLHTSIPYREVQGPCREIPVMKTVSLQCKEGLL